MTLAVNMHQVLQQVVLSVCCGVVHTGDHTGLNRPCYFIDKAYHAQAAGADALLVINDNPGDLSTAVAPKDEDSSRQALLLLLCQHLANTVAT
jgi:hypothetical protein